MFGCSGRGKLTELGAGYDVGGSEIAERRAVRPETASLKDQGLLAKRSLEKQEHTRHDAVHEGCGVPFVDRRLISRISPLTGPALIVVAELAALEAHCARIGVAPSLASTTRQGRFLKLVQE